MSARRASANFGDVLPGSLPHMLPELSNKTRMGLSAFEMFDVCAIAGFDPAAAMTEIAKAIAVARVRHWRFTNTGCVFVVLVSPGGILPSFFDGVVCSNRTIP